MTTTEQERERVMSLDEIQQQVDTIYTKHTAATIAQANQLETDLTPIMIAISQMPRDKQHSALAIMQLREAKFGRDVEQACGA